PPSDPVLQRRHRRMPHRDWAHTDDTTPTTSVAEGGYALDLKTPAVTARTPSGAGAEGVTGGDRGAADGDHRH
ncbi:hypothetical protein ACWEQ8_34130, partial [Streptomyces noursei]